MIPEFTYREKLFFSYFINNLHTNITALEIDPTAQRHRLICFLTLANSSLASNLPPYSERQIDAFERSLRFATERLTRTFEPDTNEVLLRLISVLSERAIYLLYYPMYIEQYLGILIGPTPTTED